MNPLLWPLRSLTNALGLAWWARVGTHVPDAVYWFGPFVRRRTLETELPAFVDNLRQESPGAIEVETLRLRRGEPLTERFDS